ncbi:MAG: hypothetical protein LBT10_06660 [Methanobrevibacter sp.]|jgi:hypothetical protein|nr:hypothetical protein [Methanobrevibacter sp.]
MQLKKNIISLLVIAILAISAVGTINATPNPTSNGKFELDYAGGYFISAEVEFKDINNKLIDTEFLNYFATKSVNLTHYAENGAVTYTIKTYPAVVTGQIAGSKFFRKSNVPINTYGVIDYSGVLISGSANANFYYPDHEEHYEYQAWTNDLDV